MALAGRPALIAHVIHRLDVGGLENGLVNLINRLPSDRYRHVILSLTDYSQAFRQRIQRDVPVYALHKRPGQDLGLFLRLWQHLRRLRPDIVHSRNLATLESQLPALLAGVRLRVHGEHGRDVHDLDNAKRRYRLLRMAFRPLIHRYIPLSRDLAAYLADDVGVDPRRISIICNGVDTRRFHPRLESSERTARLPQWLAGNDDPIIGTVGRLEPVKDQMTLLRAFAELRSRHSASDRGPRLLIVGDGSERASMESFLRNQGLESLVWLAGTQDDIPAYLRAMDIFVLPSLGEGISNTILEAMATGLPIVATDVGGNAELVREGRNGYLVPRADPASMADRLSRYLDDPAQVERHGQASRARAESDFSLDGMVERYRTVYEDLLSGTKA